MVSRESGIFSLTLILSDSLLCLSLSFSLQALLRLSLHRLDRLSQTLQQTLLISCHRLCTASAQTLLQMLHRLDSACTLHRLSTTLHSAMYSNVASQIIWCPLRPRRFRAIPALFVILVFPFASELFCVVPLASWFMLVGTRDSSQFLYYCGAPWDLACAYLCFLLLRVCY